MADIELVIKIPEGIMEYINNNDCLAVGYIDEIAEAIKNGIPLPKGHGKLIEARAVVKALFDNKTIDDVPTIIEADKAESEDKG